MFVFMRAVVYSVLFIGFVVIYLPANLLEWTGIVRRSEIDWEQFTGIFIGTLGAAAALWSLFTFAAIGRGTPAPFDPPRRLVIQGPYHLVRNPMYIGAGLALSGLAVFYESLPLLGYTAVFILITHCIVFFYEEPTLRRAYGKSYIIYCNKVNRWLPRVWPRNNNYPY
jgi:protein-S-isoprenylcysteine O-methyltransferase Ste14